ncbi:hypothetical protein [uncultured Thalassolituus sp.]|uniref:hypothetical protein n=1 Tax=uncultured Thalassolituus sp. TaxID=285273 RepID=UPI002633B8D2|nr:hypothetical protein [uncultured Thalassolituus sp.]
MLDVHIDDFFKDASAILLTGIQQFPVPITLFIEDISGPDDMDEFGLHSRRHLEALGTLVWLKDEGYIRFGTPDRQESVDEFILTSKAFTRLIRQLPDTQTPVFRALYDARTDGNSTQLTQLLSQWVLKPDYTD